MKAVYVDVILTLFILYFTIQRANENSFARKQIQELKEKNIERFHLNKNTSIIKSTRVCIAIPTVSRKEDYLLALLGSLNKYYPVILINGDHHHTNILKNNIHQYYPVHYYPVHYYPLNFTKIARESWHYKYSLDECEKHSNYVLIVEDDVVANDLSVLDLLIDELERLDSNWVYLRLFTTEKFMGFSRERYDEVLILIFLGFIMFLCGVKLSTLILLSLLIFLIDRSTFCNLVSRGFHKRGIVPELPDSCCTQSILYNMKNVKGLSDFLVKSALPVDLAIYNVLEDSNRYTFYPNLFQHIGVKSTLRDQETIMISKTFEF
jgi:hypothetical protein